MIDLIERLRAFEGSDELGNGDFSLLSEAAANMEALRAEVRDLRKRQAGWERHVAAAGCEYVRDGEHDALVNRRAERLLEALRKYGQHDDTCGVNRPGQIRCTCGLSAAIQDQEDCNEG